MTTEASDPTIRDWTEGLEEELVEAGMEAAQARAYGRAFELGMTRVFSVMVTRQEFQDELRLTKQELRAEMSAMKQELRAEMLELKQDLRAEIAQLRDELRREMEIRSRLLMLTMGIGFGIMAGMMSAIIALLA